MNDILILRVLVILFIIYLFKNKNLFLGVLLFCLYFGYFKIGVFENFNDYDLSNILSKLEEQITNKNEIILNKDLIGNLKKVVKDNETNKNLSIMEGVLDNIGEIKINKNTINQIKQYMNMKKSSTSDNTKTNLNNDDINSIINKFSMPT